jgi:cellulose synthase/poly-beta-1,6-N-acetylglucosamine synthase-like glycosyltransferase
LKRTLEQALALASPRIVPRPATLLSTLIHFSVVVLWLLLFARAFFLQGVVAWSTGIAYVLYDTLLLAFVTFKTLPLIRPPVPLDPDLDQRSLPSMGVIVASHNEAAVLPVTLAALLRQTHGLAQIVIADDGSTDGTGALRPHRGA